MCVILVLYTQAHATHICLRTLNTRAECCIFRSDRCQNCQTTNQLATSTDMLMHIYNITYIYIYIYSIHKPKQRASSKSVWSDSVESRFSEQETKVLTTSIYQLTTDKHTLTHLVYIYKYINIYFTYSISICISLRNLMKY